MKKNLSYFLFLGVFDEFMLTVCVISLCYQFVLTVCVISLCYQFVLTVCVISLC